MAAQKVGQENVQSGVPDSQVGARVLRGNEPVPPSVWPPRVPSLPTMGVRLGLFRAQQAQKFILGLKGVMPTLK